MSDARVTIKMVIRSCNAASDFWHHNNAEAQAQLVLASRTLNELVASLEPVEKTRGPYLKSLYHHDKQSGTCCRCSSPARKNFTMCKKHASEHAAKAAVERKKKDGYE